MIIGLVFPIPLDKTFDYLVPEELVFQIQIGKRVKVPFGNKKIVGIIYKIYKNDENYDLEKLKSVIKILDKESLFSDELLNLAEWLKNYYFCSIGEALWSIIPKSFTTRKINLEEYFAITDDEKKSTDFYSKKFLTPNKFQQIAIDRMSTPENKNFFLLHGVAGSGKTEVYLHCIKKVIEQNKSVIYLVPEISLTPQTLIRLQARFGEMVGILHSQMTDSQKFLVWKKIIAGEIKILVGPRSAIFAPFTNLGLIVIDEEQEDAYKQDQKPSYDARKVAEWRASYNNSVLILGTATPSIDTFYATQKGKFQYLELPHKISEHKPENVIEKNANEIVVIDMRFELMKKNFSVLSQYLQKSITEKLAKKEQVLLFLNRRGESTFVFCRKCGFVMKCPNCDISLVYHGDKEKLECHYCGHSEDNVTKCPSCASTYIKYHGNAIQKVEKEIQKLFPDAKVARLDKDISSQKNAVYDIYKAFKNQKLDILIGTQIIAKGLDFANLSLVGVISADTALNLADFRASERTFNLLTQVVGRAGRAEQKGLAIIQTYYPEHYTVLASAKNNYVDFYKQEIVWRNELKYPPFSELILLNLRGKNNEQVEKEAKNVFEILSMKNDSKLEIIGPYQPILAKKYNNHRWQILIKIFADFIENDFDCANSKKIEYNKQILADLKNYKLNTNVKMTITIDPVNML
jgi:primosomal protein N' (replication factor Y)